MRLTSRDTRRRKEEEEAGSQYNGIFGLNRTLLYIVALKEECMH